MTVTQGSIALLLSLIAVLVLAGSAASRPEAKTCAKVAAASGDILLVRGGTALPLELGADVYPDDLLISREGWATLLVSGEERFDVYPNSMVRIARRSTRWTDLLDRWMTRAKAALSGESNKRTPRFATAVIAVRG